MNEKNTVWIQLYTPGGAKLGVTIGFADGKFTETLPPVALIDAMIAEGGYLLDAPGVEPGEDVESILYVCRKDHTDTKTGAIVPHIALYSENDNLQMRWLGIYLDTPDDVAAFELATGLQVDKLPIWNSDMHPKQRNDPKYRSVIVKLPKSIRVARETYQNKDGENRHKLKRYVDSIGTPQPVTSGNGAPASGNSAPDNVTQGNFGRTEPTDNMTIAAPDEKTWKQWVFEATKFLYTDADGVYKDHLHRESLKKRMDTVGEYAITPSMTLYEVLNRVMRYRALKDMFIDSSDYDKCFEMPFEDYVNQHGHVATWKRMNEFYAANMPAAKPKAANQ